ncbi:MAG: flagellar motor protein MotB [Tepidisphaeraceae bacterium]
MAAKCKKCDPHEICEECPEWIFTLADLIMCMMGLFVLLWVLKPTGNPQVGADTKGEPNVNTKKLVEQIAEIRAAFGYVPNPQSADPIDVFLLEKQKQVMRLVGPGEKGPQINYEPAAEGTDPTVQSIRPGNTSIVGTRVLFRPGEVALGQDDIRILNEIAKELRGQRLVFMIKGHASRDEFGEDGKPEQLMDVSLRRARRWPII